MFQVSHDMHHAILELLDSDRFFKNICHIQCALKMSVLKKYGESYRKKLHKH